MGLRDYLNGRASPARFLARVDGAALDDAAIAGLLGRVGERYTWLDVTKLRRYGEDEGFTRAQGQ